jgi:hypothetical protein
MTERSFTLYRHLPRAGALLLAAAAGSAQAGVSVGVDIGLPGYYGPAGGVSVRYGGHRGGYRGGWGWGWGVVIGAPWVVVPVTPAVTVVEPQPAAPAAPARPDPVIYPRNGQGAEQTEADRQDCNRWATTQPAALADAAVFQRAVEACMDARGYTMK